MDREAWRAVIHGVAKSWTGLSDWTELIGNFKKEYLNFSLLSFTPLLAFIALIYVMIIKHIIAIIILNKLSMGSHRVGHDWSDLVAVAAAAGEMRTRDKEIRKQCSRLSTNILPLPQSILNDLRIFIYLITITTLNYYPYFIGNGNTAGWFRIWILVSLIPKTLLLPHNSKNNCDILAADGVRIWD